MKVIHPLILRLSRFGGGRSGATFAQMAIVMRTPDVRTFLAVTRIPGFYTLLVKSFVAQCTSIGTLILLQDT